MTACLSREDIQSDQSLWQEPHPADFSVMADFNRLAIRQTALSMEQLCEMQSRWMGPTGVFSRLARQVREQGRQAPALGDLAGLDDTRRQVMAEKSLQYALGVHWRRESVNNPFTGMRREYLCCVVFDDLAPYTLVERYAASAALRQHDGDYFSKLIATTRNSLERRIVFHGLLEHYDSLLPVEQSVYPINYRAAQQAHLDGEEAAYGKLALDRPVRELLERHTPKWVLTNYGLKSDAQRETEDV
jgi:hypothetical protein